MNDNKELFIRMLNKTFKAWCESKACKTMYLQYPKSNSDSIWIIQNKKYISSLIGVKFIANENTTVSELFKILDGIFANILNEMQDGIYIAYTPVVALDEEDTFYTSASFLCLNPKSKNNCIELLKAKLKNDPDTLGYLSLIESEFETLKNDYVNLREENISLHEENFKLKSDIAGPEGFATWRDAAVDERLKRIEANKKFKLLGYGAKYTLDNLIAGENNCALVFKSVRPEWPWTKDAVKFYIDTTEVDFPDNTPVYKSEDSEGDV